MVELKKLGERKREIDQIAPHVCSLTITIVWCAVVRGALRFFEFCCDVKF